MIDYNFSSTITPSKQSPLLSAAIAVPRVHYAPRTWNIIRELVSQCPKEVGWLGLVEPWGTDYIINDIIIPPQTVSAVETDISSDMMAAAVYELVKVDKDPAHMYYWGHSHVNMGCNPSGQDDKQMIIFLQNAPVFIRGIYNKRGESRVDVFDTKQQTLFSDVNSGIYVPPLTDADNTLLSEIIKSNVKEVVYAPLKPYSAKGYDYPDYTGYGYTAPAVKPSKKKVVNTTNDEEMYWLIQDFDTTIYNQLGEVFTEDEAVTYLACEEIGGEQKEAMDLMWRGKYDALDGTPFNTLTQMFQHHQTLRATDQFAIPTKQEVLEYALNPNTTTATTEDIFPSQ